MQQTAQANYVRVTPRKMRAVAEVIKGLSVNEAEAQLIVQRHRAARPLLKLLRSAVADAKTTKHLNPDHLYIESIRVNQGPMLKRFLPRARGVATPIEKKTSHVLMVLSENARLQSRFTIVVPKKEKKVAEEGQRPRKERTKDEVENARKGRQQGFFRRMFSRKTGV